MATAPSFLRQVAARDCSYWWCCPRRQPVHCQSQSDAAQPLHHTAHGHGFSRTPVIPLLLGHLETEAGSTRRAVHRRQLSNVFAARILLSRADKPGGQWDVAELRRDVRSGCKQRCVYLMDSPTMRLRSGCLSTRLSCPAVAEATSPLQSAHPPEAAGRSPEHLLSTAGRTAAAVAQALSNVWLRSDPEGRRMNSCRQVQKVPGLLVDETVIAGSPSILL